MARARNTLILSSLLLGGVWLAGCGEDDSGNTPLSSLFTATPAATATPSPTVPPEPGPLVTFFGITRADDTLVPSSGQTSDGTLIYTRATGSSFRLVIEGKPGASGRAIGTSSYQEDLTSFPDLQIEVSRSLGDGSPAVCDATGTTAAGVPATNPVNFEPTADNIARVNDLACRFRDGAGNTTGVTANDACVKMVPSAEYGFVNPQTTLQFCGFIGTPLMFLTGDTVVTARLRDVGGNLGPLAKIVIHVGP